MTAIGGENVSTTIEGRERYPINVRYPRELRDEIDKLARVLVPTMSGAQIPLGQLATIKLVEGPAMIRDENGKLSGYVYIDVDTTRRDLGGYVDDAKRAVAAQLRIPAGYTLQWSGQYEAMERVRQRRCSSSSRSRCSSCFSDLPEHAVAAEDAHRSAGRSLLRRRRRSGCSGRSATTCPSASGSA